MEFVPITRVNPSRPTKSPKKNNLEIPVLASNTIMTAREPKVLLTSLSQRKNTPETSLIAPKISAMKQKSKGDGNPSISDKDCGRTIGHMQKVQKKQSLG